MIVIIDYGMGNLHSVSNAVRYLGYPYQVSDQRSVIESADKLILPGVGAFSTGMASLRERGLVDVLNREVQERQKPMLGICLGVQLFARESQEGGRFEGLGWIDATVERLAPSRKDLKIPHVGWNSLSAKPDPLFASVPDGASFYFVHSYHVKCRDAGAVIASTDYGGSFTAGVRQRNIVGVQFHPEKSKNAGLQLLGNFLRS